MNVNTHNTDASVWNEAKNIATFQKAIQKGIQRTPKDPWGRYTNLDEYGAQGGCRYYERTDQIQLRGNYFDPSYGRQIWGSISLSEFESQALHRTHGPMLVKFASNKNFNTCFLGGAKTQTPDQLCRQKSPSSYAPLYQPGGYRLYDTYHFCPCAKK